MSPKMSPKLNNKLFSSWKMGPIRTERASKHPDWQQQITKELVRTSFHCIAYLRHLFDETHFVDYRLQTDTERYNKRNDVRTKRIKRGVSQEGDYYLDWIEKGISDAIDTGHLSSIQLSLYLDENDPSSTKEAYVFQLDSVVSDETYFEEQKEMEISQEVKSRLKMTRMIRNLILETQKMDPLPVTKYASVHLQFDETCSPNYQSPTFINGLRSRKNSIAALRSEINGYTSKFAMNGPGNLCVGLEIATSPESDSDLVWTDPSNRVHGSDIFNLEDFKNVVDIPPSYENSSLSLSEFLERPRKTVCATQPLSSIETDRHNLQGLDCECGGETFWAMTTSSCQICQRKIHSCCYVVSATSRRLKCYTCIFGCVNSDLLKVIRLRYLWNLFMSSGIPRSVDLFEVFNTHSEVRPEDMKELLNTFFAHQLLFVIDQPLLMKYSPASTGLGVLVPPIEGIIDHCKNRLTKQKSYSIAFAPRLNNLAGHKYDPTLQSLYLPSYSNQSAIILHRLRDFFNYQGSEKGATRKTAEATDPIETSSSMYDDEKQLSSNNRLSIRKEAETLSFEDSLQFLSQSQQAFSRLE